ncbi:hypothetical protein SAMN05421740_101350 [Parapedobacter koreensis]|uniref:Uncharacterized protein n=2 Tax=Parapedobacter koreensis TaxID=332977 RepID=A0A1H7FLL1_9SPHI|nr:hypothetical protein SAMN05421740_101350 [Parapedobacter koreensis]
MAVKALAIGTGDIRSRLTLAYDQLKTLQMRDSDIPEQFRTDWDFIMSSLTTDPIDRETREVSKNLSKTDTTDCITLAESIFDLMRKLNGLSL